MKQGWEIKKLGDVCELMNGYAFQSKQYTDEGYFVIRIGNVQDGYIELNNPRYIKLKEEKQKKFILQSGDILISLTGNVGRVGAIQEEHLPAVLNQRVAKIAIKKEQRTDKEFLLYFLSSEYFISELIKAGRGAAQQNISTIDIESLEIPLPPLPEQQRIVSILNEAFAAIAKAKANAEYNLKNAKELFESYLQGVFESKLHGSQFETLESLCELVVDCEHKTAPIQETGYPSIRTPNIGKGVLILEGVNRVSEKTYKEWTRRAIPQADDLILAREAPAGNIAVIPENVKVCLGQRTVLIRPKKNKIVSKFLAYLVLSKDVQEKLLSHSTGATVQHINMKDIRAFKIYNLSKIEEQQAIVQKLDALSAETKKLEAIYQQKIIDLEELKKSVLQKAFSGELKTATALV